MVTVLELSPKYFSNMGTKVYINIQDAFGQGSAEFQLRPKILILWNSDSDSIYLNGNLHAIGQFY
jgi:hypothetical protein